MTTEVTIVRPETSWPEALGGLLGAILSLFIRGGLIAWGASEVSVIPDWGYIESVFVALLGTWIFHAPSNYRYWTKRNKAG